MSSLWNEQPRNWVAHWGSVQTGVLTGLCHLMLSQAREASRWSKTLGSVLGLVSSAAVALYGVVTLYENNTINSNCGTAFFVCFTLAMVAGLPSLQPCRKLSAAMVLLSTSLAVGSLSRFLPGWWGVEQANLLEWLHWFLCWVYLICAVAQTGEGSRMTIAVVSSSSSRETHQGCRRRAGYVKMQV